MMLLSNDPPATMSWPACSISAVWSTTAGGFPGPAVIDFFGIDPRRFKISWVSAAEGAKWSALVAEITKEVLELGPFTGFPSLHAEVKS